MPQKVQQIIQDRYIDQRRLQDLLAQNFALGTYSMTVSSANCTWTSPSLNHSVENQQMDYHRPSGFDRGNARPLLITPPACLA